MLHRLYFKKNRNTVMILLREDSLVIKTKVRKFYTQDVTINDNVNQ